MTPLDADGAVVKCSAPPSYLWLKARIDWYVALVALVLLAPVLLVVAFLVRRDGHRAFFRQVRAGQRGCPFTLLKFRTMRPDTEPYGDSPQHAADPRLTKLGKRLRETSLDELPQIINVLRGEMSLVGPRPLYVQQMEEWNARQRCRLLVQPGLTGFAQIQGRGSLTVEEKLERDVQYVQQISLRTDVGILWHTVRGLWTRGGIYEIRYSKSQERRSGGA